MMANNLQKHAMALGYPEKLLEPIAINDDQRTYDNLLLGTLAPVCTDDDWIRNESVRKFELLFEHCEIDIDSPDGFFKMAWRLALDWVPGFTVTEMHSKGTKPKINSDETYAMIAREIDRMKLAEPGKLLKEYCGEFLDQ